MIARYALRMAIMIDFPSPVATCARLLPFCLGSARPKSNISVAIWVGWS